MKNIIAFVLAAITSAAIVMIAFIMFIPGKDVDASGESDAAPIDLTVSQSDSREALYNFRFALDGEEYSLPCKYSRFEKNGWLLKNPAENIDGLSNLTGVYLKKYDSCLKTEIINYKKDPVMCCNGEIHSVSVSIDDFDEINICGSVAVNKSTTPTMLRQNLGEPDEIDDDDEKISLIYKKAEYKKVVFIFYKKRMSEYNGHTVKESGAYGGQLDSGYYGHVVIFECRTDQ